MKKYLVSFSVKALLFCVWILHLQAEESSFQPISRPFFQEISQFKKVSLAKQKNLVKNVFRLNIPGFEGVYNPSIVKSDQSHYIIAFRQDLPWIGDGYRKVKLGLVETDLSFTPTKEVVILETGNEHSPDPRLFFHNDQLFITYAHLTLWGPPYECCIGLSTVNSSSLQTENNYDLLYKKGPREKNWAPFSYTNEQGNSELYFVYEFNPFTVLRVQEPITGDIEQNIPTDFSKKVRVEEWERKWGKIRGGTPALLVDGEYLTFFHSSFKAQNLYWYVFGAMTFDNKPPFTLKRISEYPILFKDIYQAPLAPRRNPLVRAMFPSGFVQETLNKKEVFHVLCGENDSAMTVVTLDKKELLKTLLPVTE